MTQPEPYTYTDPSDDTLTIGRTSNVVTLKAQVGDEAADIHVLVEDVEEVITAIRAAAGTQPGANEQQSLLKSIADLAVDIGHARQELARVGPLNCLANPAHPHYNKGLVPLPDRVAKPGCPFCDIVAGQAPATIVREWDDVIAIVPLDPVVEGHTLVVPKTHVEDFAAAAYVAARTMSAASMLAHRIGGPMNLITSRGREATQSVFHLHVHLLPRAENDGLALPWHSGRTRKAH